MKGSFWSTLMLGAAIAVPAWSVEVSSVSTAPAAEATAVATVEATAAPAAAPTAAPTPVATGAPTEPATDEPSAEAEATATPGTTAVAEEAAVEGSEAAATVSPSPEAELSPEATAEASPTATPEADLEVMNFEETAEASPEPTAEPTVEPTVEPTPEEVAVEEAVEEEMEEPSEMEPAEIQGASSLGGYERIERFGAVLGQGEWRVDGEIVAQRNGEIFGKRLRQVVIEFGEGVEARKGDRFLVLRDGGTVTSKGDELHLGRAVGVVKVIEPFENGMLASVERQFSPLRKGDLVRKRLDFKRAFQLARTKATKKTPQGLGGKVLANSDGRMMTTKHGHVHLDLGMADGLAIGMRLNLFRKAKNGGALGSRTYIAAGNYGQVEVVNVFEHGAVAEVIRCKGEVRVGDLVQGP